VAVDRLWHIVRLRYRSLVSGRKLDRELDEELREHVERQVEVNVANGMTPQAARTAALRAMGGVQQRAEECRDQRGVSGVEATIADLRRAIRGLAHSPAFTLTAVTSLGLGIGVFLAIVQLVDAVRLRPLPVADAHELVEIKIDGGRKGWGLSETATSEMTLPLWRQLRASQTALNEVFAWGRGTFLLGEGADATPIRGLYFSGELFPVLRIQPALGRLFSPSDDVPGCAGAVVLSHAFWQSHFGGDPAVIGRPLTVLKQRFEIAGVAPASFTGLEVGRTFDLALPVCAASRIGAAFERRDFWWLSVMGRLSPERSVESAAAQIASMSAALLEATMPAERRGADLDQYRAFRFTVVPASHGMSRLRSMYEAPLWLLLGTTALILLLTSANLATLMLARGGTRARELATAIALGASRRRLMAQAASESLLLAAGGLALAMPIAMACSSTLVRMLSTEVDPLFVKLALDWRAIAIASVVAVSTALVFGLAPAVQASRIDVIAGLRAGGRSVAYDRRRAVLQRMLVTAQLAISFVLVVSASLFVTSFRNIVEAELGFNPRGTHVIAFADPTMQRLPGEQRIAFQHELIAAIQAMPGAQSAAAISQVPLSGASWTQAFFVPGAGERQQAKWAYVSPDYFRTLEIPVVSGRAFSDGDRRTSAPVAIVNQAFVRRFQLQAWLQTEPEPAYPAVRYAVVGVVGDTKYGDVREDDVPIVYVPLAQVPGLNSWRSIIVRTTLPLAAVTEEVRRRVRALNPEIRVLVYNFEARIGERLIRERTLAWLAGAFGVLALALAAFGLYGLMAYLSVSRRGEIGVRLALGATPATVIGMLLRQTSLLAIVGLTIGAGLTAITAQFAEQLLFNVSPRDAASFLLAAGILLLTAASATLVPAWRAARLNPATTLRAEAS